jgi:hypothetical protein
MGPSSSYVDDGLMSACHANSRLSFRLTPPRCTIRELALADEANTPRYGAATDCKTASGYFKEPLQKRSASSRDIICGEVNWRA